MLAFPRLREAVTSPLPAVGEMERVPSELVTEDTVQAEPMAKHPEERVRPFTNEDVDTDPEVMAPPPDLRARPPVERVRPPW